MWCNENDNENNYRAVDKITLNLRLDHKKLRKKLTKIR